MHLSLPLGNATKIIVNELKGYKVMRTREMEKTAKENKTGDWFCDDGDEQRM